MACRFVWSQFLHNLEDLDGIVFPRDSNGFPVVVSLLAVVSLLTAYNTTRLFRRSVSF